MSEKLITCKEVSELISVSLVTARRMVNRGDFGPVSKISRKCVRVNAQRVNEYIKRHTEEVSHGN